MIEYNAQINWKLRKEDKEFLEALAKENRQSLSSYLRSTLCTKPYVQDEQ